MDQVTEAAMQRSGKINWSSVRGSKAPKIAAYVAGVIILIFLIILFIQSYENLIGKGLLCEALAMILFSALLGSILDIDGKLQARSGMSDVWKQAFAKFFCGLKSPSKINWTFFLLLSTIFLLMIPFSIFLKSVGLAPGLMFIVILAYLWELLWADHELQGLVAMLVLVIFIWVWGEAGKPGLVVMPVDLPQGREDMEFTSEELPMHLKLRSRALV